MNLNPAPKQSDRISFSFGMKLSLPTKYESADFHVSLTSDVNEGETNEQALNRVKAEVLKYANNSYKAIRASEDGLQATPEVAKEVAAPKAKVQDVKSLRKQIKSAFSVLEAQKKIVKAEFVTNYLNNKKVDELTEDEVTNTYNKIKTNFTELGL